MSSLLSQDESKVLCIYTGGTIGMLDSDRGYVTQPGYIFDSLRSQSRFHDPFSSSVHANSYSIDTYKTWTTSPAGSSPATPTHPRPLSPTLKDAKELRSIFPRAVDEPTLEVHTERGVTRLPSLVMPRSPEGRRVRYAILEYERLIDSSDIETSDYLTICRSIQRNYQAFDAFVVLHGTDTMAYTASALSFLLENLGKTVVITGAQIPLSSLRNDAVENLLGSLMIAGNYVIPEVSLYFNFSLLRGNRSTKCSSFDFDAFDSPNLEPLVKVGIKLEVRWDLIVRPTARHHFQVHSAMCENVAVLRLFPSIAPASVRAFLKAPIEGVVLETYGAGNAPQKSTLLEAFREASERGVVVVNVSQCAKGTVASEIYETGRALASVGIIGGRDMTTECALAKLAYLLSKPELTRDDVRSLINRPIRGELSIPPSQQFAPLPVDDRLKFLMGQIARLSQPAQAPVIEVGSLSQSHLQNIPQIHRANKNLPGLDDVTVDDVGRAEEALLPVLVTSASAKDDSRLKSILDGIFLVSNTLTPPLLSPNENASKPSLRVLNDQSSPFGHSPLHVAASFGRIANVELLLNNGASVHVRDVHAHTPLFYAALNGHDDVVKLLRNDGAHLGEKEVERGDVGLAIRLARLDSDSQRLVSWKATGVDMEKAEGVLHSLSVNQ